MKEKVLMARVVKKDPEEKEYLICVRGKLGEDTWEFCEGRTEAYKLLKSYIEEGDVDLEESFVLVENVKLEDRKTAYQFMKYAGEFYEDNFDIEDYTIGDHEANERLEKESEDNTVTSAFDLENRLTMEELIGKGIETKNIE